MLLVWSKTDLSGRSLLNCLWAVNNCIPRFRVRGDFGGEVIAGEVVWSAVIAGSGDEGLSWRCLFVCIRRDVGWFWWHFRLGCLA